MKFAIFTNDMMAPAITLEAEDKYEALAKHANIKITLRNYKKVCKEMNIVIKEVKYK